MNLKQATFNNRGMQQDLSISKDGKDFAYKNINIRIQATGDGTLASVTNIKSPTLKSETIMLGKVLNSILCGKYIVVFTHDDTISTLISTVKDRIYRIDLEDNFTIRTLYEGDLNFSCDKPIDSTYYYENDKVQKVYWVDGWTTDSNNNNYPRVINIITEGERDGSGFTSYDASTNFDFYPEIDSIPEIVAIKNFDVPSELPSGTIQYFVSYFNKNNSETLIAAGTSLYSIDLKTRGAKADETGCAFNVTITNVSNKYEYIRLYSVRRTSFNGDTTVNIVKDFKIMPNTQSYTVLDNGMGQVTIDPGQIFFIGGTPLFAKTLCQKDNTLFVGGIKTEGVLLSDDIKEALTETIIEHKDDQDNIVLEEAGGLIENTKTVPASDYTFNSYYPYKLQKDNEAIDVRTFKVGEIYRFGIQFQTKQGQWSEIVWIGDKKIANKPSYNSSANNDNYVTFNVSNIKVGQNLEAVLENILSRDTNIFINYRLVMADPEYSNGRSIIAQGVVCPTMFVPSLRTQNSPHTISSWVMRPRGGTIPYHHLEPLTSARYVGSELASYDPSEALDSTNYKYHTLPFEFVQSDSSNYERTQYDTNFYVDESIVDLYSPDLNTNSIINGAPKLRLVGYAPLTSNYSNAEVVTKNIGINLDYTPDIVSNIIKSHRVVDGSYSINPLYSDYMYLAPEWRLEHQLSAMDTALYNLHMWHFSKSIIGFNIEDDTVLYPNPETEEGTILSVEPLILESNSFYNHLFSKNTVYMDEISYPLTFGLGIYNGIDDSYIQFKKDSSECYAGTLEYLHTNNNAHVYSKSETSGGYRPASKTIQMSCPITFNSTPHATFYLGEVESKLELLPVFSNETGYSGIFTGKYPVDGIIESIGGQSHQISGLPAIWKDLKSGGPLTSEEENVSALFDKNLSAVGLKLGAAWIDNFAFYENSTDVGKVYDRATSKYKTCCVVSTSVSQGENFENKFRTLIRNAYSNNILTNYNYTENINGVDCIVLMAYDNGGDLFKKCYWSDINNINFVEIDNNELNKSYPYLYSVTWNYVDIWEGRSPLPSSWKYKFVYPYKEYDVFQDSWIVKGSVKNLDSFPVFSGEYIYNQDVINEASPSKPYLFVGELYYDIPYQDLYGGYDKEALNKLTWIPISKVTSLTDAVNKTEGDTYYQRWDCLKTFPKTPEDTNQVVDITSFMVETHINLDERTDMNRANFNTKVTPNIFNLFNGVYNQKNNLFSYTTFNELLSEENSHQASWSLTKNIVGTVDTWTNITSANTVNLKHPVTKLVNFNNKVVGLTEHSVEIINFNARNLVPTEDNTFIELKNSAKVDGTIDFTTDKGSRNMSVLVTEAGLYFIDDNENSLIRINYKGEIQNLGLGSMDSWFKQNVIPGTYTKNNTGAFHLEYDAKYKDIYICSDNAVLVYNEPLNSFTSFVDYQELVSLFTNKGKTYAITFNNTDTLSNRFYELYGGTSYGYGFDEKELPYSIQYRINPGPYSDKVFTNIEFKADLGVSQNNSTVAPVKPFDYIRAWTEYQDTLKQSLVYDRLNNLREKFRTWRAFIPRNKKDNKNTRDRIRNPWMHLELSQDKGSLGQKLEFHNISVTYME